MPYEMKLEMSVTKDGAKFSDTVQTYSNMSYENMQSAQSAVVNSLLDLGNAKLPPEKK